MTSLEVVLGDLTTQRVDGIVNAANSTLLGGGGVDGAIHAAAGPRLLAECRRVRRTLWPDGLPVGEAVATGAGDLPCRWVIHTVGPNWNRGERDPDRLASCYRRCLEVAAQVGARSVAFPAVSAGAYGWDGAVVAEVAVTAVRSTLARPGLAHRIDVVRFVLFSERLREEFTTAVASDEPPPSASGA